MTCDCGKENCNHPKFWTSDPLVLLKNFCVFPTKDSTFNQTMNCLTTLTVVVSGVLLFCGLSPKWVCLSAVTIIAAIAIYTNTQNTNCGENKNKKQEMKRGVSRKNEKGQYETRVDYLAEGKMGDDEEGDLKEGFSKDGHHLDSDFIQTNVTPLVAEEWHYNPPAYELVSAVASNGRDPTERVYGKRYDMEPPFAPYKQYLTRTNLLPGDEATVSLFSGGSVGARSFANDAFTRHTLAYRENMTRLTKKLNNRRYRNLGYDTISPYTSF